MHVNVTLRLMANTLSQCSAVVSSILARSNIPALFTRTSIPSKTELMLFNVASMDSASVTSHLKPITLVLVLSVFSAAILHDPR
jgi:hypothetical protein